MNDGDVPLPTAVSAPFWDATRERRLTVQWCTECDRGIFYPRVCCPGCLGTALEWRTMSGAATVYAPATHYRPDGAPFCVALVDLREGVRLLSNVVDADPDQVRVGQPVRLAWRELLDGRNLPVFAPAVAAGPNPEL